jgi:hypothetical protein
MTLRYVLDEHLRGPLWRASQQHDAAGAYPIDATRVGDPPDLPLGSADSFILVWAERQDRVVVSADYQTMPGHLKSHLGQAATVPACLSSVPKAPCRT